MSWYDAEGTKVPAGKCAGCGGALRCHNDRCDYFEEMDRKYRAEELAPGWQFRSPIGCMETIERLVDASEATGYQLLIYTKQTGPDYCWRAFCSDKIEALPPRYGTGKQPNVVVAIHEWDYQGGPIQAGIVVGLAGRPDFGRILIEAHHERGEGWTIASRLNGRDLTTEKRASKAQARTVVRQWAKQHAKTLGIQVREGGA